MRRCIYFAVVKNTNILVLFMSTVLMFSSCSVEKRRYTDGFHVEWKHRSKTENNIVSSDFIQVAAFVPCFEDTCNLDEKTVLKSEVPAIAILQDVSIAALKKNEKPHELAMKSARPEAPLSVLFLAVTKPMTNIISDPDSQELSITGSVFGMIGFVLGILTVITFILGTLIATGWAALGWIAVSVALGLATSLFALTAQSIFWANHQGVPWFQWLPLAITFFSIVVLLKILFQK